VSEPLNATGASLVDYLQQLTEALAATHTQEEVLTAALGPAIKSLGALSGAVLLLDANRQLKVAARQGHDDQTVWRDGLVTPELPSGDAILRREALYFEHPGDMTAAYPQLEKNTGGVAAVASALLPLLLDSRALGVLILDFKAPHPYTKDERRFLLILTAQTSVALDRAQMIQQSKSEAAEQRASATQFQALVQASPIGMAVGSQDGQLTLVNEAYLKLLGYTRAEYEAGGIDWQALTPEDYWAQDQRAFETAFTQGISTSYEKEMLTKMGQRLPVGVTLVRHDAEQVVGYVQDLRAQKAQEQVVREEGERLEALVSDRTAALETEQFALQAFVRFTEASTRVTDVLALAEQAKDVLRTTLGDLSVGYYELEEGLWKAKVLSEDIPPATAQTARAGFPFDVPSYARPFQERSVVFTDAWDAELEGAANTEMYGAGAFYPYFDGDEPHSLFSMGTASSHTWTDRERNVFLSISRSLGLALERAYSMRRMQLQSAEVESRNRALEAFSTLTGVLDVRLNRYELIRRTQELVLSLLPPGYAAYFEPEDGLWRLKVQVGDVGQPALQAVLDAGVPVGVTPTLDMAMNTGEPYFVDIYDKEADIDPEVAGHLNAAACLPISIRGQFVGIFNVPLFQTRVWDATDRAVLISAVQSLMLALEGAQSLAELGESNQSLQEANGELEAFTYSASHDLRTPVRHVMGFAELAEKAMANGQYEKVGRSLEVVKQAALRMSSLIDGMLLLSRSGRQDLHLQPVDLNVLVIQARRDAATEFGGHPVRWQIGELPSVMGDHQLLQQVMTNLLSNAVKYSAKREVSEVSVWCEESASDWRISVQDNGVGFAPEYAQRLFGIFQRLHSEKEFKGTGVGLATVKRIVQKHGGRVFAESDGLIGATFGFTLPRPH